MLGKPKYKLGDTVSFRYKPGNELVQLKNLKDEYIVTGSVYIVDAYGTFEQNEEPSYDVMVVSGELPIGYPCLFKHLRESGIC